MTKTPSALKTALDKKNSASAIANGTAYKQSDVVDFVISGGNQIPDRHQTSATRAANSVGDQLDAARCRIADLLSALAESSTVLTDRTKIAVSRSKDLANQMSDQLSRINRILGPDFETRLVQLERFVRAMETLQGMKAAGDLLPLLAAINKAP